MTKDELSFNNKMELKEDVDVHEERPTSPLWVLHQISEEAVRVANEYLGSANTSPVWTGHKRSQSEVVNHVHRRSNSFQNFKYQISKAWRWGGNSQYENGRFNFNPEVLANQKRQWYQLHTQDRTKYQEPTSLFEHFIVTGLHPDANLEAVENAFARRKKWEAEVARSDEGHGKSSHHHGPSPPVLDPQILFKYPPGKRLPMRLKDLCAFSFPGGVKCLEDILLGIFKSLFLALEINGILIPVDNVCRLARLKVSLKQHKIALVGLSWVQQHRRTETYFSQVHLHARLMERTPSLSDLNSLVYGQEHMGRDDLAFVFSLKAADNGTLYGVCLHVPEIVQRPPAILGSSSPLCNPSIRGSRFLVSAPRCYCLLTRVPFFELHYEMLNSIISQERLNRITQFVSEMSLCNYSPSPSRLQFGNFNSPGRDTEWMSSAIPVDTAIALTAAAAGLITDDEVPSVSPKIGDTQSPSNASESSDCSPSKELDQDGKRNLQDSDDLASDASENGAYSPEATLSSHSDIKLERSNSSLSLYSSVRSMDEDDCFSNQDSDCSGDFMTMEWAKENKNDLVQIVCAYGALTVPQRGDEVVFQPLEHLQAIQYKRLSVFDAGINESTLDRELGDPVKSAEVNARLAAAEEATALSLWTTATICRALSLDSILALLTGVLLEKQVVVVGSNLGVLSAVVLSIIPMIRPFEWQSLFLSILPAKMLDFLDAPVPYIVGIENKPAELKIKTSNLVLVNVAKDQVKMCSLPLLPRRKDLFSELRPLHRALADQSRMAEKHPVYKCNEEQAEAAARFSDVIRRYLETLCVDLRSYTITSVQSNNDRVSLLLKDSFIDSFSSRDRPFIKLFVDTQMFTVLSDSRLATFENGKS